jgi:malate dehydrogenase (oxaloacetate-decarboxylating)(NADP+)
VGKDIKNVTLVASGAGAAALSCLNLLVTMGLDKNNIIVTDSKGVIYQGRTQSMDEYKQAFARDTSMRTLAEAMVGADIFLGLSAGNLLKPEVVESMGEKPIVFALANPTPEIDPDLAKKVRPDVIVATGRSDFPNQVNNVLCFPFLFRGALDVGATEINEAMKVACVEAISKLARAGTSDVVANAYHGESLSFGPEYLIPKPFDQRLILEIAPAVAQAAMDSGVATHPIEDMAAYRLKLTGFVFRSGMFMKPVFDKAREKLCKVVFAEGENVTVLQAVDNLVLEKMCYPIVLARLDVVNRLIAEYGLSIRPGVDFEVLDYDDDKEWWSLYHSIAERTGQSLTEARDMVRTSTTIQGALMLKMGKADTMICGTIGRFHRHLKRVLSVSQQGLGLNEVSSLSGLILSRNTLFICDTQVTPDPTVEAIAKMTIDAAEEVKRFGLKPKVALLSHSNFGSRDSESSVKMRKALKLINELDPTLMVEGEMHADAAMSARIRDKVFPNSNLKGSANLLIMPNLDAANITANMLKVVGGGVSIGPILLGCNIAAHIATPSITVRGLVNLTAIAAARCEKI